MVKINIYIYIYIYEKIYMNIFILFLSIYPSPSYCFHQYISYGLVWFLCLMAYQPLQVI